MQPQGTGLTEHAMRPLAGYGFGRLAGGGHGARRCAAPRKDATREAGHEKQVSKSRGTGQADTRH